MDTRVRRSAATLAAAALLLTNAATAAAPTAPVLAIVLDGGHGHLARLDARTLRPLAKSSFLTNGFAVAPALSPSRSAVALGSSSFIRIRLVDVRSLREEGEVRIGRTGGNVVATSWPTRRTLFVAGVRTGTLVLATIDPSTRTIVLVRSIRGLPIKAARTRDGLAVLVAPPNGIGAASLAIASANGVRLVTLPVRAGRRLPAQPGDAIATQLIPGLAVDGASGRAYVFDPSGGVVQVELATGRFTSHHLRERRIAKVLAGPSRSAAWLGGGHVAVTGTNDGAPAGLVIADVRNWTTNVIDRNAATVVIGGGLLLASSDNGAGSASVRAFDSSGRLRFELDGLRSSWVQIAGNHAVVDGRIVDLPSGRVIGELRAEPRVVVLSTDGSQFPL